MRENEGRGLQVIAFSIDENPAEVRRFWTKAHYAFPAAMRDDIIYRHYGRVSTTPLYYVIDRKGVVRERISGPIGADRLVRPLVVVDIATEVGANPDAILTLDHVRAFEGRHGRIPDGAAVFPRTG